MPAAKHPPGYVITCSNLLSLFVPNFSRWRFAGALTLTTLVVSVMSTIFVVSTNQDKAWANLTSPTHTFEPTVIRPTVDFIDYLETLSKAHNRPHG
jgi:hypothetical protein